MFFSLSQPSKSGTKTYVVAAEIRDRLHLTDFKKLVKAALNLFWGKLIDLAYIPIAVLMKIYEKGKKRRLLASLKACGKNIFIGPQCIIRCPHQLEMGDNVCINTFTHIFADGGVKIGDNSLISSNCSIGSITHPIHSEKRHRIVHRPVEIGCNVWIGMGAVVLPGVSIGDHSIVGAGAVVTKNVPPKTVVVGNPARFLKAVEF
jgi:acetyltransferase-like isoleucine patch superfamily enzyme